MDTTEYARIATLLDMLATGGKKYDVEKIKKAYLYAEKMHEGQVRKSGDPYITHPVAVAEIVASLGLDTDSICAAFLHDTVEDCSDKTDIEKIEELFGTDVALLVDGVTKIVSINVEDKEEQSMENIRKMLLAMSKDIRVIFVKLCDRLHNMRTLYAKPEAKRRATALETMHIYAPLAHRLGMQRIKQELENLSLQYLDPVGYSEIRSYIDAKYGENQNFIENIMTQITRQLKEQYHITCNIKGRVKTEYSIYRKMYNQNKTFDEIYDFYALRIIVETELECYTVLGIVHELFKSVPGRFKDYISTPKPNMYQSLHTTVIGKDGIPFEIQIRTRKMHEIAEYGVAAHWKYKSGESASEDIDHKLEWISRLIDVENEETDPDDFIHAFKMDIFHDETFVFTPKGDVIALPLGATLIDFAYSIHTGVGNKMVGAKINGVITPIDRVPKNGDIVEVLTSNASKGPSRDWLSIVKTSEARNKIKQWFKKEKREENIVLGKAEVEREFSRFRETFTDSEKEEIIANVAKRCGIMNVDDFYNAIGFGGIALSKVSTKIRDERDRMIRIAEEEKKNINLSPEQLVTQQPAQTSKKANKSGVLVDGEAGCVVKFAKCCNPLPGDDIIGFITKGFGISVHKADCPNVRAGFENEADKSRFVNVAWDTRGTGRSDTFEGSLQMVAVNRISLLADVSAVLADMRVNILSVNSKKYDNNDTALLTMTVSCRDVSHFEAIMTRLRNVRDVIRVNRTVR